jgi:hypothetical protein
MYQSISGWTETGDARPLFGRISVPMGLLQVASGRLRPAALNCRRSARERGALGAIALLFM